ncbi:DUF1439 domain-containing protein [Vibrio sp. SS-MA-C1-2]|uniref:DUF1439 domain-containing protein n=1 Tax=Vibrio sp. SS-MA-C1-2 TaxID=2908646 RepID=UPI001F28544F|nr:DUF1439 domain-containing protein [Vibrio sp. SS-MA-C1-2]UJF17684.1 DUF1439 domain-containing protein [Vibrio sp. SS-MA-C1-2]
MNIKNIFVFQSDSHFQSIKVVLVTLVLFLSGCANYSVSESEVQQYLSQKVKLDHSVGVPGLMSANAKIKELEVGIGRIDKDRVNVIADIHANVQLLGQSSKETDINIGFDAIPFYNQDEGAIYLKQLELNSFSVTPEKYRSTAKEITEPVISMLRLYLSEKPIYKLNDKKTTESLIKDAQPQLKIENNSLVISVE